MTEADTVGTVAFLLMEGAGPGAGPEADGDQVPCKRTVPTVALEVLHKFTMRLNRF